MRHLHLPGIARRYAMPALLTATAAVAWSHAARAAPPDGWVSQCACKPWSIQLAEDNVRKGKYALRFEVRHGDVRRFGPEISYRAELSEREVFKAVMGQDYWYGFSMFLPADFPEHDNRLVLGQWHEVNDPGEVKRSPALSQRYQNGTFFVQVRYSAQKIQTANDGAKATIYRDTHFRKGVWHDFVYHVKWSYREDGFVQMWQDGKQAIDYHGPVGYNDDEGPFFKFGVYRDDVPETYVVYFDEYRRGDSYEAVDPANNEPVD